MVDFIIVFGLGMNKHAADDDEVLRLGLGNDSGGNAIGDRAGNGLRQLHRHVLAPGLRSDGHRRPDHRPGAGRVYGDRLDGQQLLLDGKLKPKTT